MKGENYHLKWILTLARATALAILLKTLISNQGKIGSFIVTVAGILTPFIIGGVIACLMMPVCNF